MEKKSIQQERRYGRYPVQLTYKKSIDILSPCCGAALESYDLDLSYCVACKKDYFMRCHGGHSTAIEIPLDKCANR